MQKLEKISQKVEFARKMEARWEICLNIVITVWSVGQHDTINQRKRIFILSGRTFY